jgi:hypothetical protein
MADGEIVETTALFTPVSPSVEFRKLDVNIRDNDYVAGRNNITAIVIRNTYTYPVRIISVTARHSSLNSNSSNLTYRGSLSAQPPLRRHNRLRVRIPVPSIIAKAEFPLFEWQRISRNEPVSTEPLYITAEAGSKVILNDDIPLDREVYITAAAGSEISREKATERSVTVSPSSEIVSEYTWRTNSWLLFIPSRIGIDIEIQYLINNETRSQVVSSVFDIKPPIQSVVFGGIAGGIIGNLARSFTEAENLHVDFRFFIKLIGTCLLSVMAVFALSRKPGSQSFITVEDFFGAFVLGSLIGYEGTTFFERTVLEPNTKPQAS